MEGDSERSQVRTRASRRQHSLCLCAECVVKSKYWGWELEAVLSRLDSPESSYGLRGRLSPHAKRGHSTKSRFTIRGRSPRCAAGLPTPHALQATVQKQAGQGDLSVSGFGGVGRPLV